MEHWWTGGGEILSGSKKREPLHKHSDEHTTTPMLTCVELWNWNTTSYPAAYLLSHLSMGQRRRETRRVGRGEGGRETYILHLSVEECAWGQLKRLYHNLGHCLRRRAHGALALIRDRHTAGRHTPAHTHSSRLCREKHRPFSSAGATMSSKRTARFSVNVRSRSCNI